MAGERGYKEEHSSPACQYLKLAWDKSIRYSYPDPANCCHKANKVQTVSLIYQEQVCLTVKCRECPILMLYKQDTIPRHLRKMISESKPKRYDKTAALRFLMQALFVAGTVCIGVGIYLILLSIIK